MNDANPAIRRPLQTLALAALLLLPAAFAAAQEEGPESSRPLNVAIAIYDGVELLDFAGPGEVFAVAAGFGSTPDAPAFNVYTVATSSEAIVSQGFVDVVPDFSIADAPPPDLLVLPGGGTGGMRQDAAFMAWAKKAAADADLTLTVCTGAFILGDAGMLDGRDVTTWYGALNRLAATYPAANVQPGRRFVDSGEVVTTAGVSAGIDGALHVVARLLGRQVAEQTAQYMEYRWSPEAYLVAGYPTENPRLGPRDRLRAEADRIGRNGDWPAAAERYRALTESDPADGYAWYRLGYALHAAGKYEEAIPAHEKAAGFERYRTRGLYNLACALALTGDKAAAIEALERAAEAGFTNVTALRGDQDLASLQGEPGFEALVARMSGS